MTHIQNIRLPVATIILNKKYVTMNSVFGILKLFTLYILLNIHL